MNLVLLVGLIVFVLALVGQYRRDTVILDPLDAPGDADKAGLTKDVLALMLRDRIASVAAAANPERVPRPVSDGFKQLDVSLPGTGLSFKSLVEASLGAFNMSGTRISGTLLLTKHLIADQQVYRLILRVNLGKPLPFFDSEGVLDDILQRGALAVLKETDPYVAAGYLVATGGDPDASLGFIYRLVVKARSEEKARLARGLESEVPWAYLMWAYALQSQQAWTSAANKFGEANNQYIASHRNSAGWDLALDGRAFALMQSQKPEDARQLLDHVLGQINPRSVSALYHSGKLAHETDDDLCKAIRLFKQATDIDPNYSLAWEGWGDALLEQATRIHYADPDPASTRKPQPCLEASLDQLEIEAEQRFTDAIGANPDHAPSWLQYGVLLFQQEHYDAAVSKFVQAVRLNRRDAYAWYRLGQARLKSRDKDLPATIRSAAESFCRATELRPDLAWHKEALDRVMKTLNDDRVCLQLVPLDYKGTVTAGAGSTL